MRPRIRSIIKRAANCNTSLRQCRGEVRVDAAVIRYPCYFGTYRMSSRSNTSTGTPLTHHLSVKMTTPIASDVMLGPSLSLAVPTAALNDFRNPTRRRCVLRSAITA